MRINGAIFLLAVLLVSISRTASASTHDRYLGILDSIPAIEGLEQPADDEIEIRGNLVTLFESFAERNRNDDGSLNRGTHAKGQCFDGEFKIYSSDELKREYLYPDELIDQLKQGLFVIDKTLPAHIRLANADGLGRKNKDITGDVRGLSYSIYSDAIKDFAGRGRQDFMMNSTPGFSNGGIKGFYEVVKTANVLAYKDFSLKPNPFFLGEIAAGLSAIKGGNEDHENISSFADISYWSNVPYTHGRGAGNHREVVKYKAEACSNVQSVRAESRTDDYLQSDIVDRARQGAICFDIKIQFFDAEKLLAHQKYNKRKFKKWSKVQWIEQGGLEWPEEALPFYHIARLTVPEGSAPQDCGARYVNTRIFSSEMNLPVGSISRVRTYVEEKSRANRMEQTF